MSTSTFPVTKDTFVNPAGNNTLNSPSHSGIETLQNDALSALESYLLVNQPAYTNLVQNGAYINASTNGYGNTPDSWVSTNSNAVQGGFPSFGISDITTATGVASTAIQGLWSLNNTFAEASTNGYTLTPVNSPTTSLDGLMGTCEVFATASAQYATNTSAPNVLIGGSQTWFGFCKPASLGSYQALIGHSDATSTNYTSLIINNSNNTFSYTVSGLGTNSTVTSNVQAVAGAWYFVVGVYDQANSLLKLWINGQKSQVVATGTHPISGTQSVSIGRYGAFNGNYFNGSLQSCGVLSTALTDAQVGSLWALTSFSKVKIRRSGVDGVLSQAISSLDVANILGKTVTLRADMWQDTASIASISITDTTETASVTSTTVGAWIPFSVTKAIVSTASAVTVNLKSSITNGEVWVRNVGLYVGDKVIAYIPSPYDVGTFPGLLQQNPPPSINGYSYLSSNFLNYSSVIASQGTFTTETDITGLSIVITVPTNKRVRLTAQIKLNSSVNSDAVNMWIKEGSTFLNGYGGTLSFLNQNYTAYSQVIISPSAGVHTYKVSAVRSSGTGSITMFAGPLEIAYILAELL